MKTFATLNRLSGIAFLLVFPGLLSGDEPTDGEKLFALHVKPLLSSRCLACHGDEPEKLKGDLDLRSREAALRGGETFGDEVLMPGNGNESYLYRTTTRQEKDYEMPPKEADQLSIEQQRWIRDWITAGAPWPDDSRVAAIQDSYAQGVQVSTSQALSDDWQNRRYESSKLWAYQPLSASKIPDGAHPIDWFIDAKLVEAKVAPALAAEALELVRRMTFGLTGLPPTAEAIANFASDYGKNPDVAVRTYGTTLMETQQYGEHFARHWLDVVRYADSAGFANDYARPNAWRYRDYVVRSFTRDKPFRQFAIEQLAGDEVDETNPENLVATGFLRMGPWEQTSMSVFKETRQMWLDDVTDSVGQTFLGHALQCAKCHDHKFDPIPTRDYYSMKAVFSTTQFAERDAAFIEIENRAGFAESDEWVKAKIEGYAIQHKSLSDEMAKRRREETTSAKVGDNGLDPGDEASLARMGKNMARHRWELDRTRPIAFSVYSGKTIVRNNVGSRIELPDQRWKKGILEKDAILTGGNVYAPADSVEPGVLSAVVSLGGMDDPGVPGRQGKRRLALARWIVQPDNPLTARVIVNRVWSWHFGKGLVGTPNNFGGTGELPTHPRLLDYLAQWFVESGWSIKKLNQLIVSSEAYRRSCQHSEPRLIDERDPARQLYAVFLPRRLAAEELRDAMLAVSGELNPQVGGIPARPNVNMEVAMQPRQIMGGTASVYEPDTRPEQRNRRSIYAERLRGLRDPFLEAFNQPGPDDSCEQREISTVAPQALTLLNTEEVRNRSIAFAASLLKVESSENDVIQRAFMRSLGRLPNSDELALCIAHWKEATLAEEKIVHNPGAFPSSITRTVMAEKTGEPYSFVEHMPAYDRYQPDLQPVDVDAKTRGLAQVCLVLFNSNEFSYLD